MSSLEFLQRQIHTARRTASRSENDESISGGKYPSIRTGGCFPC